MPFAVKAILNLPIHEYNNTICRFYARDVNVDWCKHGTHEIDNIEKAEFCGKNTDSSLSSLDDLDIPRRPWGEHDCEANAGQLLCKNKTNMGNLPLSCWKKIEIFKIVRFQSLIFTSKPKGYLLQTTKLWEKLIVITEERKKAMKPKEEVCS